MISLGLSRVARRRWRCPEASCSRSHHGANCCQNASTEQYKSSILICDASRSGQTGCYENRIISRLRAFRLSRIHVNFRSTREIGEAAQSYLSAGALDDEPIERHYRHSGPPPAMRAVRDSEEEADILRWFLPGAAHAFHLGIGACAVLCPSERAGRAIASALEANGVHARFMSGRDLDLSAQAVKVITLQSSKGLEFPIVALAGFTQSRRSGDLASDTDEETDERVEASARERRVLFVGMTRAMRALLVLTPARFGDKLFTGFDPAYWNLADQRERA